MDADAHARELIEKGVTTEEVICELRAAGFTKMVSASALMRATSMGLSEVFGTVVASPVSTAGTARASRARARYAAIGQVIGLRMGQNHLVTVEREEDLVGLQPVGRLVRLTLHVMTGSLEPGMTTLELDRAARD